jgi:hypothetical protein
MTTPPTHLKPVPSPEDSTIPRNFNKRSDPPPPNSFNRWLRRLGIRIASILSLGVISTAASTTYTAIKNSWFANPGNPHFGWLIPIVHAIQLGIIITVLISSAKGPSWLHEDEDEDSAATEELPGRSEKGNELIKACGYSDQPLSKWKEAKKIALKVEDQYQILWKCLWICWLLLYITLAVLNIPNLFTSPDKPEVVKHLPLMFTLNIVATFFNNCAAVVILLAYFVLSKPTTSITKKEPNKLYAEIIRWFTVAVVFTLIEAIALAIALGAFDDIPLGDQQALYQYRQVDNIFSWISGIGSATAMALYVGRLDSKYLGTPSWVLVMLYIYASIQPLYALIGENPLATLILVNAALVFKCVWFLYSAWLFQSRRLVFYFIRIRRLYQQINQDWNDFSHAIQEKKVG